MRLISILPTLFLLTPSLAADSKPLLPCTIYRTETSAYYDISPIAVQPLIDHKKAHKDDRTESWHARGYDMGTNFTLNFCAPVIETLDAAVGISEGLLKNISAFYTWKDKVYSIGYGCLARAELSFKTTRTRFESCNADETLFTVKYPPNLSSAAGNYPSTTRTAPHAILPPPTTSENSNTTTTMTMTTTMKTKMTTTRRKTTMTRNHTKKNHQKATMMSEGNRPSSPSLATQTFRLERPTSPS